MNIENNEKPENEIESQSEVNIEEAAASISSELFGQGTDEDGDASAEGEEEKSSGDASTDAADPPPQTAEGEEEPKKVEGEVVDENAAEVQEVGAPKTWSKEALAEWATIPPGAQKEILKREEDFLRGITQYKGMAEVGASYDKVVEPYRAALVAENIDPVQMFQSFAANHYLLTRGTPEQKVELAATMLNGYNIPLPELLNFMADNIQEPTDPKVAALEKELHEIKSTLGAGAKAEAEKVNERIEKEIEAFAADPAHPYFDELADDISKLFGSGMAESLADAYDKAVFANPVTRQKEIDRLTAERASATEAAEKARKDKTAKLTADSVTLTPKSRDGTVPVGSIDDTLSETMAAISNRA